MAYQALPKFIVPRHSGLTRREAVGDSMRYRAKGDLAGGAMGSAVSMVGNG